MKRTILSIFLGLFVFAAGGVKVDAGEAYTRSIYTNELQTQEEAQRRPIAVMMPTDKAAQPSFGIGNAKILYEIMEEGSISRQMAIIDDWQELEQIGNIRSCRLYYIPVATEWDPILIHFGGVYYMKERITAPDIQNLSGTSEDGTLEGKAPGSYAFYRRYGKSAPHNAYIKATETDINILTVEDIEANLSLVGLKGSPTQVKNAFRPVITRVNELIENESAEKCAQFILEQVNKCKV